jgi:uncharacterized membrane protein
MEPVARFPARRLPGFCAAPTTPLSWRSQLRRRGREAILIPLDDSTGEWLMAYLALQRLAEIRRTHPLRNTYAEIRASMGKLEKLAIWITDHVGTMTFFLLILGWTIFWLGWNLLAPPRLQFDPPMGFVFWLFISNMIQILLMPLLMIGQNIQGRQSEARAVHDLDVNIKAEAEVETILTHLERQNDMLLAMLQKQGIKLDEVLQQTS